jgi:hypothetical protein
MVGVFLVAAAVTAAAVPPSLVLDRRRRRMLADGEPDAHSSGDLQPDEPGTRSERGAISG